MIDWKGQHPSDEQPQQEEIPTESQDTIWSREKMVQGPGLEADQQKLAQAKTRDVCVDGPEDKGKILPNARNR
ncbi:PREDICTED: X antigen family member 3-like [Galeopterus variegatus]|uniref:X antigen family member 3-like n=1 Tax=Galeopterus variegatus TaxID=482537 RepID=A0ABM0QJ72_GALVR|nr:PREDICTED: X antigen family member 3-like [Galeopterus variegatus]